MNEELSSVLRISIMETRTGEWSVSIGMKSSVAGSDTGFNGKYQCHGIQTLKFRRLLSSHTVDSVMSILLDKYFQLTCGYFFLYTSQSRLCSRAKRVWSAINPGWTFARESPAANKLSASRPTGLSLANAIVLSWQQNKAMQKSQRSLRDIVIHVPINKDSAWPTLFSGKNHYRNDNNKNDENIFKIKNNLTGIRSPGPSFNFPSLNSLSLLFLSLDSPYTIEPSMYEVILLICCLGVLDSRPVHLYAWIRKKQLLSSILIIFLYDNRLLLQCYDFSPLLRFFYLVFAREIRNQGTWVSDSFKDSSQLHALLSKLRWSFFIKCQLSIAKWCPNGGRSKGLFLKVPKLFGPISGVTIPFISSQPWSLSLSKLAILLVFLTIKTCQEISFSKQAD